MAGYTASAVSKRYGMSVDALRKRASKQGWCKAHYVHAQEIPPPLHPFPSDAEAVNAGFAVCRSAESYRRFARKAAANAATQTPARLSAKVGVKSSAGVLAAKPRAMSRAA